MIDWLREFHGLSPNCKLRTYRIFKTDFCLEPHLLCIQHKKASSGNATVRGQPTQITNRSWQTFPADCTDWDRLCTYCEQNVIDDENHFMIACNFHDAERESLYVTISPHLDIRDHNDIMGKFKAIMESRDLQVIKLLSRYIVESFCKREYHRVSILDLMKCTRTAGDISFYLSIGGIYARQGKALVLRHFFRYRPFIVVY